MKTTKLILTLCVIAFISTGCSFLGFGDSKKYEMRKSPCACFENIESVIYNG